MSRRPHRYSLLICRIDTHYVRWEVHPPFHLEHWQVFVNHIEQTVAFNDKVRGSKMESIRPRYRPLCVGSQYPQRTAPFSIASKVQI